MKHNLSPIDIARANWPTNCRYCGASAVKVLETRPNASAIRRRKHCEACGQRETTYEISQARFKELEMVDRVKKVLMEGSAKIPEEKTRCSQCKHWEDNSCDFGFPDAGGFFAADCSTFILRNK